VALAEPAPVIGDAALVGRSEVHLDVGPGAPVDRRSFRLGGDYVGDRLGRPDRGDAPFENTQWVSVRVEAVEDVLEDRNQYKQTGKRRQLYAYSISAKRYALATQATDGTLEIIKASEHGLGHLLNPLDPDRDDRDWFTPFWHATLTGAPADQAPWLGRPAVSRISISSPTVLHVFDDYNTGRPYDERVKPFNFLLAAYVAPFGHPAGYPPERFQLIAPYEPNPHQWRQIQWIDRYSGDSFSVHVEGPPSPDSVKLRSYGDVLARYQRHPEPKSLGPDGQVCAGDTTGLLQRRRVTAVAPIYIGKESNNLEERQAGLIHNPDDAYSIYHDPGLDTWQRIVLPALQQFPATEVAHRSGLHRRSVERHLSGRSIPHPRHRAALTHVACELASARLEKDGHPTPREPIALVAAFIAAIENEPRTANG
jgi:hypothetical protein